jgi:hypothetical protein
LHPWFVGVQFHPEFTSTPRDGHPLFRSYIEAALKHRQGVEAVEAGAALAALDSAAASNVQSVQTAQQTGTGS